MSRGRPAPDIEGLVSLKVDNLSYNTSPADLRRIFDKYGEIGDIHIPRDRYNRQSRGFGFVRFCSRRDAEYALDRVDGKWIDGREMRVTIAKYERVIDEKGDRGGGRRRSRSRSRSRSPRRSSRRSRTQSPPGRSRSRSRSRSSRRSRSRSASPRKDDRKSRSRSASRSRSRSRSKSR